ncbi:MAG TPA: 16S rRNA (uracil(1498)-N(3))-methyltransferase [Alphaproteobacteria bacterium]|nr:16S rRNA (uracil(1498)-N(3))-methyltransferase [Alphaproteobacteria bacterium]
MSKKNRIRLFAETPLKIGEIYVANEDQTHYLKNVMRLSLGDEVFLFDGVNGEFETQIIEMSKKTLSLKINKKVFNFEKSPDVWLLFANLKKENTDIVVQKAVELGVSKILPVQTEYTFNAKLKPERVKAQVIEAAEQCRRQDIPNVESLQNLQQILSNWDKNRTLVYLDETGSGESFSKTFSKMKPPVAFLIGPEGGFSSKELEMLKSLPYTLSVSLGKRILRAETACISALSCWQAMVGDWK